MDILNTLMRDTLNKITLAEDAKEAAELAAAQAKELADQLLEMVEHAKALELRQRRAQDVHDIYLGQWLRYLPLGLQRYWESDVARAVVALVTVESAQREVFKLLDELLVLSNHAVDRAERLFYLAVDAENAAKVASKRAVKALGYWRGFSDDELMVLARSGDEIALAVWAERPLGYVQRDLVWCEVCESFDCPNPVVDPDNGPLEIVVITIEVETSLPTDGFEDPWGFSLIPGK